MATPIETHLNEQTQPAALRPLSAPERPNQWQRIEHHTRTLDRVVRMTQHADAKSAPVLALHASLAAVAVTRSQSLGDLLLADGVHGALAGAAWILLAVYAACSLLAFQQVAAVFVPRRASRGGRQLEPASLVYFEDITRMALDDFRERGTALSFEDAEQDVLTQVHLVSTLAARKLQGVQRAYYLSGVTLAAWLPLILLGHI